MIDKSWCERFNWRIYYVPQVILVKYEDTVLYLRMHQQSEQPLLKSKSLDALRKGNKGSKIHRVGYLAWSINTFRMSKAKILHSSYLPTFSSVKHAASPPKVIAPNLISFAQGSKHRWWTQERTRRNYFLCSADAS